ncbi:hypothetical protein EC973_002745 [Apophysomyces ossiformis]|uniref:Uncharacterized protein n=1 Tax=Apophysomyces ossiformis TaxID=679940 RepID=A0A8H7ESZ7_9FUNG|nr:hypothetical protein EC973_002745 [Apophysomyces ossiformis]
MSAKNIVSLKFSDERPDVVGLDKILRTIGVRASAVDIPEEAKPILKESRTRALTEEEKTRLISLFYLNREQLLEQVKLAGRQPAVQGGGDLTEEKGTGPYPKVYDTLAWDQATRKAVLEKYGRFHVNSGDDGTDIDEVMTIVSGGPFRWGFTLQDGVTVRFQVENVGLDDPAVRVSYHGLGMHAGMMDAQQGVMVAFGHGAKVFTMRYDAPGIPHAELLGTNPWVDFSGDMPRVLDHAN